MSMSYKIGQTLILISKIIVGLSFVFLSISVKGILPLYCSLWAGASILIALLMGKLGKVLSSTTPPEYCPRCYHSQKEAFELFAPYCYNCGWTEGEPTT